MRCENVPQSQGAWVIEASAAFDLVRSLVLLRHRVSMFAGKLDTTRYNNDLKHTYHRMSKNL